MEPVRIKHWGFWPVTKRRYLIGQAGVGLAWILLLVVYRQVPQPFPTPTEDMPGFYRFGWQVVEAIPYILGIVAMWFVVDMAIVLFCFARKEDRQKVRKTPV